MCVQDAASGSSIWNCDGEIVNEAAISVKVHRQLVPVFARYTRHTRRLALCSSDVDLNSKYHIEFGSGS